MKRNKILALIGAGVLSMGVVGVALAEELQDNQVGQTIGSILDNVEVCDDFEDLGIDIGAGEIGLHFILTQPEGDSATINVVTSTGSGSASNTPKGDGALHFYVVVTGDMDSVLESAETSIDGGNLVLSHACSGEETTSSSSTTTFTDSTASTTTSVETTSSSSSSSSTTFTASTQSTTTNVTQPPTDTIGNSGSGQQSSGLWMLLAALGVLAGSVIVLAPSKAKSKD